MAEVPQFLQFPRTINKESWEQYLCRRLNREEMRILFAMKSEHYTNNMLSELNDKCNKKGLCIPELTNLYGDCMFESLKYHNLGNSVEELRRGLAFLMYMYRDNKTIFPSDDRSLKEIFELTNEIEYVTQRQLIKENNNERLSAEKKFFKYTYNVMCQDLCNNYCWTRLPAQLILMAISRFFCVEIVIINDTTLYEHTINVFSEVKDPPPIKKIYLGHLGEAHYVPIDIYSVEKDRRSNYTDARTRFFAWAYNMQSFKVKNYVETCQKLTTLNEKNTSGSDNDEFEEVTYNNDNTDNAHDTNNTTNIENDTNTMVSDSPANA